MNRKLKNFIIKCAAGKLEDKLANRSTALTDTIANAFIKPKHKTAPLADAARAEILASAMHKENDKSPLTKLLQKSPGVKKLISSLSRHRLLALLGSGLASGGVAYGLSRAFKGE